MYKKCKAVMLPSSKRTNILLYDEALILVSDIGAESMLRDGIDDFRHLYIVSLEEEMKKGEWYYSVMHNKLFQCVHNDQYFENEFKVIASTDSSLNLPFISPSFIDHYIAEYNKGNRIEDVMVEYEEYMTDGWVPTYNNPDNHNLDEPAEIDIRIKINPDNTISIKEAKSSWSREEVINLIKTALDENNTQYSLMDKLGIDKWINKNL